MNRLQALFFIICMIGYSNIFADTFMAKDTNEFNNIINFLGNPNIQDKAIEKIKYNGRTGLSVPSVIFSANYDQFVSIILFNNKEKLVKILLYKYLNKGHYQIYFNHNIIESYFDYPDIPFLFYLLTNINGKYKYGKGILIK